MLISTWFKRFNVQLGFGLWKWTLNCCFWSTLVCFCLVPTTIGQERWVTSSNTLPNSIINIQVHLNSRSIPKWFSFVSRGIITFTLNWTHPPLNYPIQIATTSFIFHLISLGKILIVFLDNLEDQMCHSNIHSRFTPTISI
jgi:hypothetical protein